MIVRLLTLQNQREKEFVEVSNHLGEAVHFFSSLLDVQDTFSQKLAHSFKGTFESVFLDKCRNVRTLFLNDQPFSKNEVEPYQIDKIILKRTFDFI